MITAYDGVPLPEPPAAGEQPDMELRDFHSFGSLILRDFRGGFLPALFSFVFFGEEARSFTEFLSCGL
jgi:hypothetical protein